MLMESRLGKEKDAEQEEKHISKSSPRTAARLCWSSVARVGEGRRGVGLVKYMRRF